MLEGVQENDSFSRTTSRPWLPWDRVKPGRWLCIKLGKRDSLSILNLASASQHILIDTFEISKALPQKPFLGQGQWWCHPCRCRWCQRPPWTPGSASGRTGRRCSSQTSLPSLILCWAEIGKTLDPCKASDEIVFCCKTINCYNWYRWTLAKVRLSQMQTTNKKLLLLDQNSSVEKFGKNKQSAGWRGKACRPDIQMSLLKTHQPHLKPGIELVDKTNVFQKLECYQL